MRAVLLGAMLLAVAAPVAVASDFDNPASNQTQQQFVTPNVQRDDTPDDPDYDSAETDGTTNLYDERFDLFGFPSKFTPSAIYKDPADTARFLKPMVAGFNAAGAWKLQRGRRDVSVAVLDTGINWDDEGMRTQIRLNPGELPAPTSPNANGHLDVDDYIAETGKPKPTAQDLIRTYSDGTDADGNGYVDDIAGWDFFDDDNDPGDTSSYFAASGHGTGRAKEVAERGNDGQGSIGVCPKCQVVPLRIWDTFVSDQTTFGLAMLYATDLGVKVIEGADGGLYHSAFTERASDYAYAHGVAQVFSGDDLNTGNHNYPANYSHTMLIQGTVADTYGLGTSFGDPATAFLGTLGVGTNVPTGTLFRGAGTTQYGGHSSVSMIGATGSENTGKAAGAAALVYSAGLDRTTPVTLRADEVRAIVEQTAEDVTPLNTLGAGAADQSVAGWDPHFGWGRVNLGDAVQVAQKGSIPPEAAIWGPDWFAPVTGGTVAVTGRARARFSPAGLHWKLEWGVGETPSSWHTAHEGDATGEVTDFGDVDLTAVRAELADYVPPVDGGAPAFGTQNPFQREFSVRLTVAAKNRGAGDVDGVDRRVFTALDDGTIRPSFPKRMGAGGEAPIRYADLDGDNEQDLVVPLEDGTVHAYDAGGDDELPGFPVKTDLFKQATGHADADGLAEVGAVAPPREPPRAVTIADLDDDGSPEIITTAGRHVYVWETDGTRRAGFPAAINPAFCRPEDQERERRHHKCGFLAPAAVGHLEGPDGPASIVAPALDGHVYAFRPNGDPVPHFPVELVDPAIPAAEQMEAESINAPAIGDLDGDGFDDVVIASNESYPAADPQPSTDLLSEVLSQAGGTSRLYAVSGKTGAYLPGWPAKLPGAIQDTLPLIGPGHDASIMTLPGGEKRVVASTTGSSSIRLLGTDASDQSSLQMTAFGAGTNAVDRAGAINLFESAVVGDVLGTGTPAVVKYGLSLGQVVNLLLVGQNQPYNHLITAFDATTSQPLPAFPRITEDYQFLSSSTIAKVDQNSTANQVLAGSGLGLLHAYDGLTGLDAPGFPKVTGGWLFAPAALSDAGRTAAITREGYLFVWGTGQPKCQPDGVWASYRHDDRGSGNTATDGVAPGTPEAGKLEPAAGGKWTLTFRSPGDDALCGTPTRYTGTAGGDAVELGTQASAAGQTVTRTVTLPGAKGTLVLGATDEAGNRGIPLKVPYDRTTAAATATPTPVPSIAPSPAPTGTPGTCTDTRRPSARITSAKARRRVVIVRGTAKDVGCAGLKRVSAAVKRRVGHGKCRFLRRSGRFGPRRPCAQHRFIPAKGLAKWTLTLRGRLPKGRYLAMVRTRDRSGNLQQSVELMHFRRR